MLCLLQSENFLDILLVILLFSAITNGAPQTSTKLTLQEIRSVRCLTHFSHRYFAPDRSLVISSPATCRDVQQKLIAEIHRTAIWLVVVDLDENIRIPEESDFIDRDSSYITLIPDGNTKYFPVELIG